MFTTSRTKAAPLDYLIVGVGVVVWAVVSQYLPVTDEIPGVAMMIAVAIVGLTCRTGIGVLTVVIAMAAVQVLRPVPTLLQTVQRDIGLGLFGGAMIAIGVVRRTRVEATRQYQVIFEQNPLPMWVYDAATLRYLRVNDAAVRTYGYTRAEFAKMSIRDIRPKEDLPEFEAALSGDRASTGGTWRHLTKDGRVLDIFLRAQDVTIDGRQARLALLEDISDRRDLEAQLRQSQKMEAVGQLAAGVAHDFNNLLAVIQGFTTLTLETLPEGDSRRNDLQEVVIAGTRAADLTRQLLAFSRKQLLQMRVLSVSAVVSEMTPMLRRLVGETIVVGTGAAARGLAKADVGQLQQIVMNLVVNARDAMNGQGHITIEVLDVVLDAGYCSQHALAEPGPHVLLAVSDTGCGMDAATQARIFEPFFTTKPAGQGTGLGLSTVYGIVKQFGGHVTAYSEVGQGTTFKVYLPRTDELLEVAPPPKRRVRSTTTQTVLLVDDEPGLQAVAGRILRKAGYIVHASGVPAEAVAMVATGALRPDVLLTDVVLPGMNGQSLANAVLEHCPTCKVVFMSGYTDAAVIRLGELPAGATFVSKPFTSAALTGAVADLFGVPADEVTAHL